MLPPSLHIRMSDYHGLLITVSDLITFMYVPDYDHQTLSQSSSLLFRNFTIMFRHLLLI